MHTYNISDPKVPGQAPSVYIQNNNTMEAS